MDRLTKNEGRKTQNEFLIRDFHVNQLFFPSRRNCFTQVQAGERSLGTENRKLFLCLNGVGDELSLGPWQTNIDVEPIIEMKFSSHHTENFNANTEVSEHKLSDPLLSLHTEDFALSTAAWAI
jgi:hypothetical protein